MRIRSHQQTGELIQRDRLAPGHRDPGITQPRFESVGIATRRIQPEAKTTATVTVMPGKTGDNGLDFMRNAAIARIKQDLGKHRTMAASATGWRSRHNLRY